MKLFLQRAFEPPEVKHDRLLLISVLGLLVNLVGIFVFQHGGAHGHSHGGGGELHYTLCTCRPTYMWVGDIQQS